MRKSLLASTLGLALALLCAVVPALAGHIGPDFKILTPVVHVDTYRDDPALYAAMTFFSGLVLWRYLSIKKRR